MSEKEELDCRGICEDTESFFGGRKGNEDKIINIYKNMLKDGDIITKEDKKFFTNEINNLKKEKGVEVESLGIAQANKNVMEIRKRMMKIINSDEFIEVFDEYEIAKVNLSIIQLKLILQPIGEKMDDLKILQNTINRDFKNLMEM